MNLENRIKILFDDVEVVEQRIVNEDEKELRPQTKRRCNCNVGIGAFFYWCRASWFGKKLAAT